MALPSTGPIDLGQVQAEFGGANPIGMDEYYQGAGTGYVTSSNYTPAGQIPGSGPISLQNFLGVAKVTAFTFNDVVAANLTGGYNLRSRAVAAGWNQSSRLVATVTVNAGVTITGQVSGGNAGFDTGTVAYPAGSTLTLVNNGTIAGIGGAGGVGGSVSGSTIIAPGSGFAGGTAMYIGSVFPSHIQVYNNGTIGGGGGGGGGGGSASNSLDGGKTYYAGSGGGGGGGRSNGPAGSAGTSAGNTSDGVASNGTAGTTTSPGAGGPRYVIGSVIGTGGGGSGGNLGSPGLPGDSPDLGYVSGGYSAGAAGGAAGQAIYGGVNIDWYAFGSRLGAIDNPGTSFVAGSVLSSGTATYGDDGGTNAAGLSFQPNGTVTSVSGAGLTPSWWTAAPATGIGASYWIRVTATGAGGSFTGTLNTWLQLNAARTWNLTNLTSGTIRTRTLTISIASDSLGTNILATYGGCVLVADFT